MKIYKKLKKTPPNNKTSPEFILWGILIFSSF